ncbi:MAG: S9 family peptidase [Chloroflexi bacterium]|nr:S9 family peptidase [Chloroflexota bacterium]MBI3731844.1 S9 family peptidase [Chloroflexota bacterium]
MKVQALDRPFDPALGQTVNQIDWNMRSFWSPQYDRARHAILFRGDESNDEAFNIYSLSLDSGAVTRLTQAPYVNTAELSPDGTRLAYVARYSEGGRLRAELRLRDMDSGEDRLMLADSPEYRLTWGRLLWGGDNRHILAPINLNDDRNRANLAWIDLDAPRLRPLLDTERHRSTVGALEGWLDNQTCLVVSNESGYMQIGRCDVTDGRWMPLTDQPYDLRSAQTMKTEHGLLVAIVLDRPQDSPMRVVDSRTGEVLWEHTAEGSVYLLHSGEGTLYGASTSLDEKWALWRLTAGEVGVAWEKVASVPAPISAATSHAQVERITYPTFDINPKTNQMREIQAFLLVPKNLPEVSERRAFVQAFYGGANTYNQNYQILAQAGFIVLSPAVRGSFGFGRDFYALIDKDLGGHEIIDLIYGARFLQERFGLKAEQIGVFGGSHGGYATLRALTFPERVNGRAEHFDWGFGWAHAGFYNIMTFWRDCNIPDWVTQKAGDPMTERDKLLDRSPLTHAERLQAPVYLTHGDRDNRVPVNESRVLAARLEELNKIFRYDEFAGHGHPLKGSAAQIRLWRGLLAFLEQTATT